jgi:hypothetical protein
MRDGPQRWEITRRVFFDRPYRLHIPPDQMRLLEIRYLEFCRTPRTRGEIEEMLGGVTDCPVDRLSALQMTLSTNLFLGGRTARGGRLVEYLWERGQPTREQTTELGSTWLEEVTGQG